MCIVLYGAKRSNYALRMIMNTIEPWVVCVGQILIQLLLKQTQKQSLGGDAFRIKCLRSDSQTPDAFIDAMRTARRINCNDYVQNLYEYHDFDFDVGNKVLIGNYEKVKKTVPSSYYYDFEEGYNLRFTRYDRKDRKKKQSVSHSEIRRTEMQKKNQSIVKNEQTVPKDTKAKPEPVPIKVNKGEMIIHKSFGRGKVVSADGKYLKVVFDGIGEKTFANPGAFEGGFIRKA